jgi:hypothetical protein
VGKKEGQTKNRGSLFPNHHRILALVPDREKSLPPCLAGPLMYPVQREPSVTGELLHTPRDRRGEGIPIGSTVKSVSFSIPSTTPFLVNNHWWNPSLLPVQEKSIRTGTQALVRTAEFAGPTCACRVRERKTTKRPSSTHPVRPSFSPWRPSLIPPDLPLDSSSSGPPPPPGDHNSPESKP